MKKYTNALTLIAAILMLAGCGGEPYVPSFAPNVGESYAMTIKTDFRMTIAMAGQSQVMNQGSSVTLVMTVEEADDFKSVVKVVTESMSLSMGDMDKQMAELAPGMALEPEVRDKLLEKLTGEKFTMEVTRDGEILSVDLDYGAPNRIVKELELTGDQRQQALTMAEQLLSSDTIKQQMSSWLSVYTLEEKGVGDTWQATQEVPFSEMTLDATSDFTLTALTEAEASIDEKTTVSGDMVQGPMSMNLEGSGTGQARLKRPTGWPIDSSGTFDIKGDVAGAPMELSINIRSSVNTEPR